MTEAEFIQQIDCAFPYYDLPRALELIDLGCSISSNAGLMVMHELARPPASLSVPTELRQMLLNELRKRLDHPLTTLVSGLAAKMIADESVHVSEAVDAMKAIAPYRDQYASLAIACFSCNDTDGVADAAYNNIVDSWKTAGQ